MRGESPKKRGQPLGVGGRIVDTRDEGVLECHPPPRLFEIISRGGDHFAYGIAAVDRHYGAPRLVGRGVQADGQRHPAPVVREFPYAVRKPRSGQRDRPLGQPETILRRQQPDKLPDIVIVIERLAAAHEHHARDRALFCRPARVAVYGDDFGEHLGGIEVALETFLPRRTERAAHLATYLRGHADARAVVMRDIDAFCKVAAEKTKEIFLAAVRGDADRLRLERERNKIVRERLAERLRERGHLGDLSAVQTKRPYLPRGVSGCGRGKQRRYLGCLKP